MSFPLINPTPTFTDSSGSPLASGTIEFRDPTSNDLINSYPTADKADAQTDPNANPLTLNSRGEAANGLYLEDGVKYKITLKDSNSDTIWTQDDVRCPIALPYLQTATEAALGITPSDYQYPAPDFRRYGAATGTADNSTAMQNAINVAATDDLKLVMPPGRWRHASTLYFYYDASNNPDFPSGAREDGRLIIEGTGAPNVLNFTNTEYAGTILEYTAASGIGLDFYDSGGTEAKGIVARDFGVYANTSGFPVQVHRVPQMSLFQNLFIGNNGAGGALSVQDVWTCRFEDIWLYGDSTGAGLKFDPTESAGSTEWHNVNSQNFAIGFDLGDAYSAGRTAFVVNHSFNMCQSTGNPIGFRVRAGMGTMSINDVFIEGISGTGGKGIVISNMAGWLDASYANPGLIEINRGYIVWTDVTAHAEPIAGIEIGDDTTTETIDGAGNVVVNGTVFGQVGANSFGLRIHNSTNAGYRDLKNLVFHNNGGVLCAIDDEAQIGPIFVSNWEPDGLNSNNWIENTSGADKSWWIARSDNLVPTIATSATYDYTNATYLPSMCLAPGTGDIQLDLPTAPVEHMAVLQVSNADSDEIILNPGANNLNGSTTDLTFDGKYAALLVSWTVTTGWTVSIAPSLQLSAYTTGIHGTLRDFTGTSSAAHALQLLETLVDDLKVAGIIT